MTVDRKLQLLESTEDEALSALDRAQNEHRQAEQVDDILAELSAMLRLWDGLRDHKMPRAHIRKAILDTIKEISEFE